MAATAGAVLVTGLLTAGCVGEHDGAGLGFRITHGQPSNADPAVVGLAYPSGPIICTATLITPVSVLTAAHCLDGDLPLRAYFGLDPGHDGTFVDVQESLVHPEFDPTTLNHDLAVLELVETVELPMPPLLTAADAAGALAIGQTIRVVGFGRASTTASEPALKRTGTAEITAVVPDAIMLAPAPSQTCRGDSGGPGFVLVDGVEYLAAVTSSGDPTCDDHARCTRVDGLIDELDDFVIAEVPRIADDTTDDAAEPTSGCSIFVEHPGGWPMCLVIITVLRRRRPRRTRSR